MTKPLKIIFDFSCPYCYLAWSYFKALKQSESLADEWFSWEIHPEVPKSGSLMIGEKGIVVSAGDYGATPMLIIFHSPSRCTSRASLLSSARSSTRQRATVCGRFITASCLVTDRTFASPRNAT